MSVSYVHMFIYCTILFYLFFYIIFFYRTCVLYLFRSFQMYYILPLNYCQSVEFVHSYIHIKWTLYLIWINLLICNYKNQYWLVITNVNIWKAEKNININLLSFITFSSLISFALKIFLFNFSDFAIAKSEDFWFHLAIGKYLEL